jgi:hypothetical protein
VYVVDTRNPSVPFATCVGEVESAVLPAHVPPEPPLTNPHETVTAPTGTVGHDPNVAGALTFRFQAPNMLPVVFHVTTAPDDPFTIGEPSGLVAENVIVAGVTEGAEMLVACGFSLIAAGATSAGAWFAGASRIPAMSSVESIGV